jgi:excisionase family DNA binding protein
MNTAPNTNTAEVWAANRLLFSRKEVASLLNLSTRQITRLITNDKLRIIRSGSRTLIHRDEIYRFSLNTAPYVGPRS